MHDTILDTQPNLKIMSRYIISINHHMHNIINHHIDKYSNNRSTNHLNILSRSSPPTKIIIRVRPHLRMPVFTFSPSYETSFMFSPTFECPHSCSPPPMNVNINKKQIITIFNTWTQYQIWTKFIYHTKYGFNLKYLNQLMHDLYNMIVNSFIF